MIEVQLKTKEDATYFNNHWGKWGFFECEADVYETQDEAYEAYVNLNNQE